MFGRKKTESDTRPKKSKSPKNKQNTQNPKKSANTQKQQNPKATKVRKKKRRGKSKNGLEHARLLMTLNLPIIEPRIVLDELKEFERKRDGLVRKYDDTYTVLVLTNAELEKSGIEDSDELGALGIAIRGDKIRSATRVGDLKEGRLIFIPNEETLLVIDEYDALRNVTFNWGLFGLKNENGEMDDEGRFPTVVCDGQTNIGELLALSKENVDFVDIHNNQGNDSNDLDVPPSVAPSNTNNVGSTDNIDNSQYAPQDELDSSEDDDDYLKEVYENDNYNSDSLVTSEQDVQPTAVSSVVENTSTVNTNSPFVGSFEDDSPFGGSFEDDNPSDSSEDDASKIQTAISEPSLFNNETLLDDTKDILVDDTTNVSGNEENLRKVVRPDEYVASLKEVSDQIVDDTDLTLALESTTFNDLFISAQPFRFALADETLDNDDSTLARSLNERRRDYNGTLSKRREINMQQLSQIYNELVNKAIIKVQQAFDDSTSDTESGLARLAIENQRNNGLEQLNEMVVQYHNDLDEDYIKRKKEHIESVLSQAEREFDEKYRPMIERKKEQTYTQFTSKITTEYHTRLYELTNKRQKMAQQALLKVKISIISQVQTVYEAMIRDEDRLRQKMSNDLNKFMQTNFTNETLRASALELRLKQESEADRVRKDYEQRFAEQNERIATLRMESNRGIADAEQNYANMLSRFRAENELTLKEKSTQIDDKNRIITDLREKLESLQNDILEVSKRKEDEAEIKYKQQLLHANDTIEAQKSMLEKVDGEKIRLGKRNVSSIIVTAVSAFALAFGIIGFVSYVNQDDSVDSSRIQYTQQIPTTASTSNSAESETLDAYVANGVDKGNGSLIVSYKDSYKKGEKVDVVGTMSKSDSNEIKKAVVSAVDGNMVTVSIEDGTQYKFVLSE